MQLTKHLPQPSPVLAYVGRSHANRATDPGDNIEQELVSAAVRFNTRMLGLVCGVVGGLLMIAATALSLAFGGPEPGQYLSLLEIFFPGYAVSVGGMAIGFCWGFVVGGLSGALVYWTYARWLGAHIAEQQFEDPGSELLSQAPVLRLAGVPLGCALGLVMALQLVLATSWLVLRGTADQSVHAALLSNYLPGYSVSVSGGLVGAAELFAFTFLVCNLVSTIYNRVARARQGQ